MMSANRCVRPGGVGSFHQIHAARAAPGKDPQAVLNAVLWKGSYGPLAISVSSIPTSSLTPMMNSRSREWGRNRAASTTNDPHRYPSPLRASTID